MSNPQTFIERLHFVLADRKLTPWCQRFGISKSRAHRIGQKGAYPEADELGVIARAEGVNLNWLIEGVGHPFHVSYIPAPRDAANFVYAVLADEDWTAYLLESHEPEDQVVVLTLPAEIEVNDQRIPYTAVEVIAGPPSMDWSTVLPRARGGAYRVPVDSDVPDRLRHGLLGPYQLVGADGTGGLIGKAAPSVLREGPPDVPDEDVLESAPPTDAADESGPYIATAGADLEAAYQRLANVDPVGARRKLLELMDRSLQELEDRPPE